MKLLSESVFFAMDGVHECADDNLEVEEEMPVFYIPYVEFDTLLHFPHLVGDAAVAVDLRPARDARFDHMAHHILVYDTCIVLGVFEHVGPWSDNGHVAEEHIDELREFVE